MPRTSRALASTSICVALFCSGAAALVFETLWFRQASLAFGNSVWASALVTSAFMGGMAVGSLLVARARGGARRRLILYGLLELAVSVFGVVLVHGLPALSQIFAPFDVQHEGAWMLTHGTRLVASLLILLLPSAAMGMTLPLAVQNTDRYTRASVHRRRRHVARDLRAEPRHRLRWRLAARRPSTDCPHRRRPPLFAGDFRALRSHHRRATTAVSRGRREPVHRGVLSLGARAPP
jgi:hypothetical protein